MYDARYAVFVNRNDGNGFVPLPEWRNLSKAEVDAFMECALEDRSNHPLSTHPAYEVRDTIGRRTDYLPPSVKVHA